MAHDTVVMARLLLEKFGSGPILVREFDEFLQEEGVLVIPDSDEDKSSQEYRGMVAARNRAKRSICAAAAGLGPDAYTLLVREQGRLWALVPWGVGADENIKSIGEKIKKHAEHHGREFDRIESAAVRRLDEEPTDEEAAKAIAAVQYARQQKMLMQATIVNVCDMYTGSQKSAFEAAKALGVDVKALTAS